MVRVGWFASFQKELLCASARASSTGISRVLVIVKVMSSRFLLLRDTIDKLFGFVLAVPANCYHQI